MDRHEADGVNKVLCFFHVVNGTTMIRDEAGVEITDLAEARVQALEAMRELQQECDWEDFLLCVTDSSGTVLFTLLPTEKDLN